MAYAADVLALLAAGASILYAHIAGVHRDVARRAADEAREQLLDAAVRRHPAGRHPQMSPHRGEETVPPVQADPLHVPGRTPKS